MNPSVQVNVYWENERANDLPRELRYTAIAWFQENREILNSVTWTVDLEFEVPPCEQGNPSKGTARFSHDNAPHDWLRPGAQFDLHEEKFKSAVVYVLQD